MTIAELHGKLAPDSAHERMEDLLTSDVFGTMKYAGWEYGFLDWLLKAEPAPIEPVPPPISTWFSLDTIIDVEFSFWPKLKNGREPDLALLFQFDTEDPLLVLIEAKYFSGTSDWEEADSVVATELTGNQIADQVLGLRSMSEKECLEWFQSSTNVGEPAAPRGLRRIHLFVTMHTNLPTYSYELSTRKLVGPWPIPAYWLPWTSLAECLEKYLPHPDKGRAALLDDLCKLLGRKELTPFHGFNMDPLQLDNATPSFWREQWWSFPPVPFNAYQTFWGVSSSG
jgi:hypothetical protein